MQKTQELLKDDLQLLNQVIRDDLNSDVALIKQISEHIINSGGKRLRPIITLLCGRIAGVTANKNDVRLHKMAAMIEYIHTATLLHDDVVDSSGLRRGYQTANAVFGNSASVLVGDFIYTRAFQMMIEGQSLRLFAIMANSTNKIAEGEVMQLLNIGRHSITEQEYMQIIDAKTAVLFTAAAQVAAIIANANTDVEQQLMTYASNLGSAFQIIDDVLDYTSDNQTLGKNIGDDLKEGKVTLPLIHLLKHTKDKQQLIDAITKPQEANLQYIIHQLQISNSIQYCIDYAASLVDKARQALNVFPASSYKAAMLELADFALARTK